MREIRVIGVTGPARSGKDTVADMIKDRIGGSRYSFAEPMYAMLAAAGFDFKSPEWAVVKEDPIAGIGKSPRQMLQTLGTEWGRNLVCEDLWIKLAEVRLGIMTRMIISDCRFDNEADWIRQNGIIIRVIRPDVELVNPHESESGITPREGDLTIDNDGDLLTLKKKVNFLMDSVIEV